jgi:hypothetical protein
MDAWHLCRRCIDRSGQGGTLTRLYIDCAGSTTCNDRAAIAEADMVHLKRRFCELP